MFRQYLANTETISAPHQTEDAHFRAWLGKSLLIYQHRPVGVVLNTPLMYQYIVNNLKLISRLSSSDNMLFEKK